MAYISVDKWRTDQVVDWLKGLDDSMYSYVNSFTRNGVVGSELLNIRPYELEKLGMSLIGHQEIVLDAVENLRNIHHNLDTENLQFLALHVATAARSLHRQLATYYDASQIETQILNDITYTIARIKPLIGWLNRAPFRGQEQFQEVCVKMLRLGLEMATIAQRDRFVEQPVDQIRKTAKILEQLANYIIQDITDPLILQPGSLSLVTLKKSDLGFNIESSFHGIHRVTDIKHNSPAHTSGKIEDGDEIVQINYQTVVAWQYKSVRKNLSESPPDVLLTLKKRPKHTKIYGQIYMQPYRLPSKKRAVGPRWGENSVPSPRPDLLTVPVDAKAFGIQTVEKSAVATAHTASSDSDSSCSDIMTPTDVKETEKAIRLYYPKPRAMLQRRNTVCGDELFGRMPHASGLPPNWLERGKISGAACDPSSPSLRDKSVSFGFGLEIAPRPTTCIGIASSNGTAATTTPTLIENGSNDTLKAATTTRKQSATKFSKEPMAPPEKFKPGVSKVVRFDANMKYEDLEDHVDEKYTCNVENTILETFAPIPYADDDVDDGEMLDTLVSSPAILEQPVDQDGKRVSVPLAEAVNISIVANLRRGRLDKSHSTPAYDNSGEESDTPPAIEPRKLVQTPPVPPPRPRKQKELLSLVVPPPPPKPAAKQPAQQQQTNALVTPIAPAPTTLTKTPTTAAALECALVITEASELNTPTRTRTLTLRKKHNLVRRRRNVNLKLLGSSSDISISSHLYRRTKDHRGVTYWARLYFVMLDTILYGFRTKDATKACSLIFLPGFTVSLAKEVHSKPHAFKVYQTAKTFYFAAESQDALNQWVEFIRSATQQCSIATMAAGGDDPEANPKDLFSETDSSGEENESLIAKNLCTPSPQSSKEAVALGSAATATPTTTKSDRRYLGSLRKLTKGTLPFKSSSNGEKKASSDIPVPTEQYRCYRKVPGGSFGIQIGTNTPGYPDSSLQSPLRNNAVAILANEKDSLNEDNSEVAAVAIEAAQGSAAQLSSRSPLASSCNSLLNTSTESAALGPPSSPAPTSADALAISVSHSRSDSIDSPSKGSKKMPYHFIHASNPNLLEIDFQTSKALDYSLPKINAAESWDAHKSPHGFVTLKDLMLQKQEEEAQEMYNNRVLLGVEKKAKEERRRAADNSFALQCAAAAASGKSAGRTSKLSSRSLPKTPDYEISFNDESIKRIRTKEGLKLRDFGYELISGDEPIGGGTTTMTTSRQNSNTSSNSGISEHHHPYQQQQQLHTHQEHSWTSALKSRHLLKSQNFLSHKSKKHSSNSCSSASSADFGAADGSGHVDKRTGSFKKKGKLEVIKSSSERLFQFNKHSVHANPPSGIMTMTLPLNKKSNHHTLEHDGSVAYTGGSGIKKSHTYNNDLKEKAAGGGKYDAHRKNSAPIPIFSKLTATGNSSKASKDKRLLGSPLLHRTLFGSGSSSNNASRQAQHQHTPPATMYGGREYDQEIFSQVTFSKVPSYATENGRRRLSSSSQNASVASEATPTTPLKTPATTPEYPHMECPPVFEPEIYSLSDPNASISLLLRRNNSNSAVVPLATNEEGKQ